MSRRVPLVLALLLLTAAAVEALWARHHHPVTLWHHLPGISAAIGLVGGVGLVLLSKGLGKCGLQQPEPPEPPEPPETRAHE